MARKSTRDRLEFADYCATLTDGQVLAVILKEAQAKRYVYAAIARAEARKRGIE